MTSAKPAAALRALESAPARAADFVVRLYKKGAEDDVLFLAGGVAFNILLAGVPFFLLLASGLGYAVGMSDDVSARAVAAFVTDLFPGALSGKGSVVDPIIRDIVRTRGAAGAFGAIAFLWFSTRLFGSLSVVFTKAFDVPKGRGIIHGKLFDVWLTLASTALVVVWILASASIAVARSHGLAYLTSLGVHSDAVMQPLAYVTGRFVTFTLIVTIFFALYKVLPFRRVRWRQALIGALTSAVLFEMARAAFGWIVNRWNPASLYTGALAAVVIVVFWIYYGAIIVIIGGEASQVWERMQKEARGVGDR